MLYFISLHISAVSMSQIFATIYLHVSVCNFNNLLFFHLGLWRNWKAELFAFVTTTAKVNSVRKLKKIRSFFHFSLYSSISSIQIASAYQIHAKHTFLCHILYFYACSLSCPIKSNICFLSFLFRRQRRAYLYRCICFVTAQHLFKWIKKLAWSKALHSVLEADVQATWSSRSFWVFAWCSSLSLNPMKRRISSKTRKKTTPAIICLESWHFT